MTATSVISNTNTHFSVRSHFQIIQQILCSVIAVARLVDFRIMVIIYGRLTADRQQKIFVYTSFFPCLRLFSPIRFQSERCNKKTGNKQIKQKNRAIFTNEQPELQTGAAMLGQTCLQALVVFTSQTRCPCTSLSLFGMTVKFLKPAHAVCNLLPLRRSQCCR